MALNKVVREYSPELYGYAEDHKLAMTYFAGNNDVEALNKSELETCLQDIIRWMTDNKLYVYSTKTVIVVYGSKQQLAKNGLDHFSVGGVDVACVVLGEILEFGWAVL